ncbi:MAG: endonuclease domain-containing protein [Alphaproteobacteria bacterium]
MDCDCEFGKIGDGTGSFKCLDHDHQTGEVRAIVCQLCNIRRGVEDRAKASSQVDVPFES